ncbi:MAG: hypothetical protein ABIG71_02195 [Candidatus Uhrbacteria bacterium]
MVQRQSQRDETEEAPFTTTLRNAEIHVVIPDAAERLLGVLEPALSEWLRQQIKAMLGTERMLASLRIRVDSTESKVDDILQEGGATVLPREASGLPPELPMIGDLLRRIEALEAQLADRSNPPPTAAPHRKRRERLGPGRVPKATADKIRIRLLEEHGRGKTDQSLRREMQRVSKEHGLGMQQVSAIWARSQGKHMPRFLAGILLDAQHGEHDSLLKHLAELYEKKPADILALAHSGGYCNGTPAT